MDARWSSIFNKMWYKGNWIKNVTIIFLFDKWNPVWSDNVSEDIHLSWTNIMNSRLTPFLLSLRPTYAIRNACENHFFSLLWMPFLQIKFTYHQSHICYVTDHSCITNRVLVIIYFCSTGQPNIKFPRSHIFVIVVFREIKVILINLRWTIVCLLSTLTVSFLRGNSFA